jgi:hypothetical protein
MGDGTTSLRYTQARRERECRFLWNRRHQETKKRLRRFPGLFLLLPPPRGQEGPAWQLSSPSVEEVETRFLREHSARSSRPEAFREYLAARREVDPHLTPFYQGAYFRSSKYSIHLATSQDRFVDRIRNAFGGGTAFSFALRAKREEKANGSADGGRAVVVAWGNWGRLPNALRNSGPTPGVGFRRFVHRRLASDRRPGGEVFRGNTVTVFEGMTSSICNACGRRVKNAVRGGERQLLGTESPIRRALGDGVPNPEAPAVGVRGRGGVWPAVEQGRAGLPEHPAGGAAPAAARRA